MAMTKATARITNAPASLLLHLMMMMMVLGMVSATDHNVGGSSNWALNVDYSTWVSTQTFFLGDNLVFTWTGNHDVVVVSASEYAACTSSSSDARYDSSPTSIPLTALGTTYYICSIGNHCSRGMKLAVTVSNTSSNATTPTSSPPSPSPITPSSPNSTTPSTSPTPPPSPSPKSTPSPSSPSPNNSSPSMIFPSLLTTVLVILLGLPLAAINP